MAERPANVRLKDQGHTRKQRYAAIVCLESGSLSTHKIGTLFGALSISQYLLHYFLNTYNTWEPASAPCLAGVSI